MYNMSTRPAFSYVLCLATQDSSLVLSADDLPMPLKSHQLWGHKYIKVTLAHRTQLLLSMLHPLFLTFEADPSIAH